MYTKGEDIKKATVQPDFKAFFLAIFTYFLFIRSRSYFIPRTSLNPCNLVLISVYKLQIVEKTRTYTFYRDEYKVKKYLIDFTCFGMIFTKTFINKMLVIGILSQAIISVLVDALIDTFIFSVVSSSFSR